MRGIEHIWGVFPCEAYVPIFFPFDRDLISESFSKTRANIGLTVKYHAYLRKMTRYNPTRGGNSRHDPSSMLYLSALNHF
jgi:hypothetical protein